MASWRERKLSKEDHHRELLQLLKDSETWRTVAGPEVWRTEVYGSPKAKALGLTLLPSLTRRNLNVQGTELDRLAWEIEALSRNVDLFDVVTPLVVASALRTQSEEMLLRFQNIVNAVAEAKQLNGGVEIK